MFVGGIAGLRQDLLENEADEDDGGVGARFCRYQERIKRSADQKGKLYKEQLAQIHSTLADATRGRA